MEIIIDIPENDYKLVLQNDYSTIYKGTHIAEAVKNGTPLTELMKELEKLKNDYQKLYVTAYTEGYAEAKAIFNERR